MTDLSATIAPKSDQLNADDLIAGPITIVITGVTKCKEAEQPIAVSYDGDRGKPYKPGKSMRRVLVKVWGADGTSYVGKSLTLYRDDKVQFGGLDVGGIRISHMSHIDNPITMALTASKAQRKPFTVLPLVIEREARKSKPTPMEWFAAKVQSLASRDECANLLNDGTPAKKLFDAQIDTVQSAMREVLVGRIADFGHASNEPAADDGFPGDMP
jgi:hypothetical protein